MHYYNYIQAIYDSQYEQALQTEIVASRIRRSRIQEEIQIEHRLRRSRIQAEIVANLEATEAILRRSRIEQEMAMECEIKERQLEAEMALTESILSRSRRQNILAASEEQLQKSKAYSQQLERSMVNDQETIAMTKRQSSEEEMPNSSRRRRVVEEDVSRILTTY